MAGRTVLSDEFGVWGLTAPPAPAMPTLDDSLDADIAIVGAGYTGLSTALHLAERGINSVVVEAHEPGWGASGRNTGWLEPNWWMKRPADIVARFGRERGEELTRWVASGPRLLARWIERYGMRIDIADRGLLMATARPDRARELETEVTDWQSIGVRNEYLDAAAVASHVGTERFRGAMLLTEGLTLNPLALSRELARAALDAGVTLFANTPVAGIARVADRWQLECAHGVVRTRRLVLATDAYTRRLWPQLVRAYAVWHAAVVASEPYEALDRVLPRGTAVADLGLANIFTLRTHKGRLVTSTFAPLRPRLDAAAVAAPFMRKFRRVFPQLPEPRWHLRHCGEIGLSSDLMPRLCAIGPDAWTAYGYSGTGINLALLLGGQLAQLAASDAPRDALYPVTELGPLAWRNAVGWGLRYLHAPLARHVVSHFA